jgi:hypothetical protein
LGKLEFWQASHIYKVVPMGKYNVSCPCPWVPTFYIIVLFNLFEDLSKTNEPSSEEKKKVRPKERHRLVSLVLEFEGCGPGVERCRVSGLIS